MFKATFSNGGLAATLGVYANRHTSRYQITTTKVS